MNSEGKVEECHLQRGTHRTCKKTRGKKKKEIAMGKVRKQGRVRAGPWSRGEEEGAVRKMRAELHGSGNQAEGDFRKAL